jgi:hypothetical protein
MQLYHSQYARTAVLSALALFAFSMARVAPAQVLHGSIVGDVTDPSGAPIPGAIVSLTNMQTNLTRQSITNTTGGYSFPTLLPGRFEIKVGKEGFRTYTQQGIEVTPNAVTRANVKLQLGQVTEQVTVAADVARLQTDRSEVRAEVNRTTLENVPVPLGRNYQMLVAALPGISQAENAHSVPSNPSRAVQFSVNGTSRSNNNTRIDGASQTNVWLPHMTAYTPSLEAIETVNVVSNSFDAEQGLAGGAAINLAIKSGTNDVHGSGFWYLNNQHLNAYPYFSDRDNPKPKFLYNQFGGTVGGPLKHNRLFYFLSYEGTRERTNEQRFVDVPDAAMRAGDLSGSNRPIYDPFTGSIDGKNRTPFPDNFIPRSRWAHASQVIIDDGRWPLPNFPGTGTFGLNQNYLASGQYMFDRDTLDSKVNMIWNDKLTSFVRFSILDYRMDNPQVFGDFGGNVIHRTNSNPGHGFGNTYSGTFSTTYVASPSLVFDGYYGYTLMDSNVAQVGLEENIGRDLLGIPGTNGTRTFEGGWPRLQIDGFEQLGIPNNFMPYYRRDPQQQVVLNGNWTKGTHEVRFGTDLYWQELNHEQPEFTGSDGPASGGFRFRPATTSLNGGPGTNDYNGFASFLLGTAREAGRIIQYPQEYRTRTSLFSLYLRDRWRASSRLTLSLGLRWEYYPFPTRDERGLERFDFDTNEMLVCGVGSVPENCGFDGSKRHFAPRVGFAFRATDTFVIRAGYGITIDPFNWARPLRTNYPVMLVQNLPFDNSRAFSTTLDQGLPAAPPEPQGDRLPMPTFAALSTFDDNAKRGYIQSWNFTLEKQLPGDWIVSAGYVATRSVNHLTQLDANWADLGAGNNGRQLVQRYDRTATTLYFGSLGTPKYDGLQTRAEKRFSNGFQMSLNYSWSHARGFGAEDSGSGVDVDHPLYYHRNYGPLGYDFKHVFNWAGVYELPFGRGKKWANDGVPAALLGGWQINNLARLSTGRPSTPTAPDTTLDAPGSSQFADCIAAPRTIGDANMWWDPSTFADPNVVSPNTPRFGTCGAGVLRGPGLVNFDLGVFRKFQVSERMDIQFRAEAFNISNTPHFNNPTSSITSGNFGVVTGLQNTGREGIDQRVFRFGLRLGF